LLRPILEDDGLEPHRGFGPEEPLFDEESIRGVFETAPPDESETGKKPQCGRSAGSSVKGEPECQDASDPEHEGRCR
jgi:hypothetical protein